MDDKGAAVLACVDQLRALAGEHLADLHAYADGPSNGSYEAAEMDVERLQRLAAFFVTGNGLVARLIVASMNARDEGT